MSPNSRPNDQLAFTSLDPPETKYEEPTDQQSADCAAYESLSERFRHSGWQRTRTLIYGSFRRTMQASSRIMAFDNCGYASYVYRTVTEPVVYRLAGSSCRDKFCLPCARDRGHCLAANVLKTIKGTTTRFVTLTLKQSGMSLTGYIDRIYDCFRRLRSTAFWKKRVSGGAAFLELKWSHDNADWNVHLHVITHGLYIHNTELSKTWYRLTGDSFITDVRFVHDDNRVGRYVTKYVSKPFNNTFVNREEQLDAVVRAVRRRRLCLTFGTWRTIRLTESPNDRDWIALGSLHDVVQRAADGDAESLEAVNAVCRDRATEMIAAVTNARPPPSRVPQESSQWIFAWPPIDPTF